MAKELVSRYLIPTLFLSHGGGPGFFMKVDSRSPFSDASHGSAAHKALLAVGANPEEYGLPRKPDAIVVVSAHWEEHDAHHVYSVDKPRLIYDYYGFPQSTYELKYPCPGSPTLAARIVEMINAKGASTSTRAKLNPGRGGFDHGVFMPLLILYPDASIPVVQVSLKSSLDPVEHWRLGEILAPLRAENILIIGSGQATHPMAPGGSKQSTDSLVQMMNSIVMDEKLSPEERHRAALAMWKSDLIPKTHIPTTEHLTPLAVVMGAAGSDVGRDLFKTGKDFRFMGGLFSMASYVLGSLKTESAAGCESPSL